MSILLNEGSERFIEYGNEKLTREFLKERITELRTCLSEEDGCDLLLTKKNLELNNRLFESCFS
ncbi:hypothetical protein BIY24_04250 [Halobacteriovorax marinus]|uniref:Uncharacterized protein n=1 Tax=Halobacteriovorax marinus (strain ATCC BAA-682 / DSM 15412 / SJ) TaxID=862908 RepID=E1WX92_HALMS|nr:hypothetical protein [Halobacteriovorax marinus]ATH07176.1 hypothetical protein BIY24_04250 [Halobacteriovorax marinus]CBW25793.1 hypothetical protein BMS_0902 [Halobacteriovorax marinus SJ]